jgi:hypothetical protein
LLIFLGFSNEIAFLTRFCHKEELLQENEDLNKILMERVNGILQACREKIIFILKESFRNCNDYRILACCSNQIKLHSDEFADEEFVDVIQELLSSFVERAVKRQAESISQYIDEDLDEEVGAKFPIDGSLIKRICESILEYQSLGILAQFNI